MRLSRNTNDLTVSDLRAERKNVLRGAGYAWTPDL